MLHPSFFVSHSVFQSVVTSLVLTRLDYFKALSTLSQKSATVAKNGETTAKFGDCCTFLMRLSHFSATVWTGFYATLAGIPLFQLRRLQSVTNATTRLVFHTIDMTMLLTPLVYRMHWLCALKRHASLSFLCTGTVVSIRPENYFEKN